jgi:hypothetical protein
VMFDRTVASEGRQTCAAWMERARLFGFLTAVIAAFAVLSTAARAASFGSGSVQVTGVTTSSATVSAVIDPEGAATSYRFVYAKSGESLTGAGAESLPAGEGQAGSGELDVSVSAHPSDLQAGSAYHFEVIATPTAEPGLSVTSEALGFTTQTPAGEFALPDSRAWELVTAPSAAADTPFKEGDFVEASESGQAITYSTAAPPAEGASGSRSLEAVQTLSRRSANGWTSTEDIATPDYGLGRYVPDVLDEYKSFTGELTSAIVVPPDESPLPPLPPNAESSIYLRNNETGVFDPLVTAANVSTGRSFDRYPRDLRYLGSSPDLQYTIITSNEDLDKEIGAGVEGSENENLYESAPGGGELKLVSVLPGGHPVSEPGEGEQGESGGNAKFGYTDQRVGNAISSNGSQVVWEASGGVAHHLYARDMSTRETVRLDVPEAGVTAIDEPEPEFQGASADGSLIFFTDSQNLTPHSHAEPNQPDLYVAEISHGAHMEATITDITEHTLGGPEEPGSVQDLMLGYSEDGAYAYFVANGQLTPKAIRGECHYGGGECTLYEAHREAAGHWATTAIGVLSGEDASDWDLTANASPAGKSSRVSPDGQFLAFMSQQPLTGYDNRDSRNGQLDQEVFLFDAATDGVRCASCNPTGSQPSGLADPANNSSLSTPLVDRSKVWAGKTLAASIPGWYSVGVEQSYYEPRYLSNTGRLFFDAADGLVPADTNGKEDAYEYESEGATGGQCDASTQSVSEVYDREPESQLEPTVSQGIATGCVALISSGSSSEESEFLDASEPSASQGGEDVFFMTTAQLASQEHENAFAIYDAHECSPSLPCPSGSSSPVVACTSAEACRPGTGSNAGVFGLLASTTLQGGGNVVHPVVVAKAPTKAQLLAKALKICKQRLKGHKRKRQACEAQARRKYAPHKARTGTRRVK